MKKILMKNGTLVTPDKIYQADILISNQKIEKISEQIDSNETEIIDSKGKSENTADDDSHNQHGNRNSVMSSHDSTNSPG